MREDPGGRQDPGGQSPAGRTPALAVLAQDALGRLIQSRRDGAPAASPAAVAAVWEAVSHDAVAGSGADWAQRTLARLRAVPASDTQLLEAAIPAVARRLGADWVGDRLSFADVTLGAARLHDLLRAMPGFDDTDLMARADPLLIVVPAGEQHTLGGAVLAQMLRRRGLAVMLRIAPSMGELARIVAQTRLSAALISVGSAERVETAAKLVKSLRIMRNGRLRIVIGGAACGPAWPALAAAGADFVTDDIATLVAFLGLGGGLPPLAVPRPRALALLGDG